MPAARIVKQSCDPHFLVFLVSSITAILRQLLKSVAVCTQVARLRFLPACKYRTATFGMRNWCSTGKFPYCASPVRRSLHFIQGWGSQTSVSNFHEFCWHLNLRTVIWVEEIKASWYQNIPPWHICTTWFALGCRYVYDFGFKSWNKFRIQHIMQPSKQLFE